MLMGKIQFASGLFVVSIMTAGLLIAERSVLAGRSENAACALPVPTPAATDKKSFAEYRGASIGTTADDLRKKLGVPKDKSDAQDFYVFSDSESAQFYYDEGHKLTAIMITYTGDLKNAPTPLQVLGEDVPPNPNGGISKMVRFPKEGYWISYNRGSGSDAMLSIAIQKM
ncbi:MAG TPA: hypothetical protein VHQ01_10135 [Pyrinomonadaceae bacterium]|jgi:hypothetical protein|nr:hypothetical protein [Pyrinomonadaceae bacterium]